MAMTRLEHAQGLLNYYHWRVKRKDGSESWRREGMKVAEWYLRLVVDNATTIDDVDELINYLDTHNDEFGGSAWFDMHIGLTHWRSEFD